MDLGSLTALMAIANDPAATQTAREFLAQQKLQADRLKAEQGMKEAELQLQENANRRQSEAQERSLIENRRQFDTETTATKDYRAATLKQGDADTAIKKSALEGETKYRQDMLGIERDRLKLEEEKNFQSYLGDAQKEYVSLRKGGGTGGIKPPTMDDLSKVFGFETSEVLSPTRPPKGVKLEDYKKSQMERLNAAVDNFYAATGQTVPPEAGRAAFAGRNSFIEMKAAGVTDPTRRQQFLDSFQKWEGSPAGSQALNTAPSPEESKKFLDKMSIRIATGIESGNELSPQEQADIAWVWNSTADPTLKAEYIDSIVNNLTVAFKQQREWTDAQALEWNGNFRAILDNAITSGDATRLSPYVLGGGPVEGPAAFKPTIAPSKLGNLSKVPQLRALEIGGNLIAEPIQRAGEMLKGKPKPKLKSRGKSGGY